MAARHHHHHRLRNLKAPVDWELLEKVGDGTFGSVYKLRSTRSGQLAAVKVVDCSREKTPDDIFPELDILKKFSNHPNIVQFLGAYKYKSRTRGDQLWLVMELCRGGSVTALVKRLIRQNSFLNEDLIALIAHEALKGLEVLHEKGVMHRDVKGANILLTSNAGVKLVDFGISTQLSHDEVRKHSSVGTPYWMSPEVIACDQQLDYNYDKRCDVWSLGITAIELADGTPPLSDEHPMRALFKIPRNPPPTVKNASKWSAEFNDFVSKCVIKDFERRPFVHEVLQHKFVAWVPHKKRELQQMLKNIMTTQYGGKDGVDYDNSWCVSPIGARRDKWRDRKMLGVDDLVTLNNLTEETILTHVMERYLGDQIYTYIGDILIAVNPFKNLPIYDLKHSLMYRNLEKQSAAPHIFAIAASAYRSMLINQHQQCCLISGESGAGKTVSSNFLVQQLAELGKSGNRKLENKILQVNPLMEAIGNAQTGINDNSSRFGKYLELHFTSNGSITGACLTEYLLEKSRVVSQSEEGRNFHVFYYFLAGLWQDGELAKYSLKVKGRYKYLQTGNKSLEEVVFTTENKQRYDEFKTALKIIGFTQEEMSKLFSIIAAIIHIGDIDFIEDHSDLHMAENSKVNNFQQLQIIASLLRVSARDLCDALTTSSNVTRGETISRKNTVEQSLDCRDAMAKIPLLTSLPSTLTAKKSMKMKCSPEKALYGALFTWIVDKINQLLFSETERESKEFTIGILDIFGFENVHCNSFEQLFINIANEQIQYYFNQFIFTMEMNEYQKEGIPTSQIIIKDNKHMLDLFLQRPMGLLALLDEESGFPKATDATLIDKFNSNIYSDCYTKRREVTISFSIKHYAGEVVYDARGFLEKNRDTMSPDIIHVLRTSENTLLRTLFSQSISRNDFQSRRLHTAPYQAAAPKENGSKDRKSMLVVSLPGGRSTNSVSRRQQTLSMTFRNSLEDLLYRLTKADPHFVRCIKPNDRKMANQFDQERVMTQLRYTGVLETTRLRKEGYSERITFQEFVRRYQLVLFHLKEQVRPDALSCKAILRAAGLDHWLVGKTKIFLKYHHVEKLATILEKYRHSVILVQRAVRAWLQRRRFKHILDKRSRSAIVLQKVYRGRLVRKKYGHMINKRQKSATIIQTAVRRWLAVTKYKKIKNKREKSATKIQASFGSGYRNTVIRNELQKKKWEAYRGYRVKKVVQRELEIRRQIERDKQEIAAKKITAVARGFQGRKEYGRRKEHSSQQETKMIYFFQQVSFLCHEFYGKQRNINTPVPVERRNIEEYKELVGPPRYEQYDQKNNNVPRETRHKVEGANKHNKKSIETSHTDVYKGRVEVKHIGVEESSKPYKKAESRLKVVPPSPQRKFIDTRSESRGERGPVVRRNSQVYKANPLIAEALQQQRETLQSHREDSEDSFLIDTSQMTYSYRAPEKRAGNESWRSSDPRSTSSNVLLVKQSSNVSYTKRRKYQERRKGNQGESTAGHDGIKTEPSVLSDLTTVGEPLGSGVTEIPYTDLRAKLRKTGQIEQTSGLHKIEIARKHSQRVIDVN